VTVGDGAYVATGQRVTSDVPADALTIARARQVDKPGRAAALRAQLKGSNVNVRHHRHHRKEPVAAELIEGCGALNIAAMIRLAVATLTNGRIERRRARASSPTSSPGSKRPVQGTIGIGHTRWATMVSRPRQRPPDRHRPRRIVHNGIIENFQALKRELGGLGYQFHTETDTEAVAILATHHLDQGLAPAQAVARTLERLEGAFALVFLVRRRARSADLCPPRQPARDRYGDGEMFVGSDSLRCAADPPHHLSRRRRLGRRDLRKVTIFDEGNQKVARRGARDRALRRSDWQGHYRHFMQKEIFEQPAVIGDTLHALINPVSRAIHLPELPFALGDIGRITTLACGTRITPD